MKPFTLDNLKNVEALLNASPHIIRTPLIKSTLLNLPLQASQRLYLKLESMQVTGSFKIRGIINFFHEIQRENKGIEEHIPMVTMSAGNYGRSFAYMMKQMKGQGVVCMPETAPADRREMIRSYGLRVETTSTDQLMSLVEAYVKKGYTFAHPFDNESLIKGYATIALELLKQFPETQSLGEGDFIVVPCGGGGLLAGIAVGLRLKKCRARIVGVEPYGAPGQYQSRLEGKAVSVHVQPTIASGLAPPFAGQLCYEIIREHVDDLILVTDADIKRAMRYLFDAGILAEPSGAASVAAILSGKLEIRQDARIICIVSGGNVSISELLKHITCADAYS